MGRSTVVILGIKIAAFKVTLYNFKIKVTPKKPLQAICSIELSSAYKIIIRSFQHVQDLTNGKEN